MKIFFIIRYENKYIVEGVFTTKENAEKYISQMKKFYNSEEDKPRIEEWPINPNIHEIDQGLELFNISMSYDGDILSCTRESLHGKEIELLKHGQHNIYGNVWARNMVEAVNIANESRLQAIKKE